jgi:hypothetical protein
MNKDINIIHAINQKKNILNLFIFILIFFIFYIFKINKKKIKAKVGIDPTPPDYETDMLYHYTTLLNMKKSQKISGLLLKINKNIIINFSFI